MTNPYSPPERKADLAEKTVVSTLNGLLVGLGIGLQTCDFIDLGPSDYTPLYGWLNGLVICGTLGAVWGYRRRDTLAWRWLVLLGFMHLSLGSTVALTTFSGAPLNIYTATMITAGSCYMSLGAVIAFSNRKNASSESRF